MYSRLAKVFYFLTTAFFIIAFLYIYALLPEQISYEVRVGEIPTDQISRDTYFFISMALFVVLNLLIIVPAKMIENQAGERFRKVFRIGDPFRDHMIAWIYSFSGILNINLAIMAFFILRINNLSGIGSGLIEFIFYLAPLFFLIWIVFLFIILGKKIKKIQSV